MARRGTLETNKYEIYSMAVDWEIESQSISGNYSRIKWRVYSKNTVSNGRWVYISNTKVTINGNTVYNQGSRTKGYGNDTFDTGYITIYHDNNGEKSFNISIQSGIYTSQVNKYGSATFNLDTIQRGISDLSLGEGWGNLEDTKTITFSKLNSNTKIEMWWQYWDSNKGEWTKLWTIRSPMGTEIKDYSSGQKFKLQYELIKSLYKDKPNNSRADILLTLNVKYGDDLIESKTITGNVNLRNSPHNVNISINFTGANQSLLKNTMHGVKGVHELNINVNATASNHATIKNVKIVVDGVTYENNTVKFTPQFVGDKKVDIYTTDSRNYTVHNFKWIKVYDYTVPTINHRAYRVNENTEDPLGNIGKITGTIDIANIPNNSAWWKINLSYGSTKYNNSIMYSSRIPVENVTDYTITYGDKFTTNEVKGAIPSASVPLSVGKSSIGVGIVQPPDSGGVWIGGSSNSRRSVNIVRDRSTMTIRFASGYGSKTGNGIIIGEKGQRGILILSDGLYSIDVDSGSGGKKLLNL